MDFQPTSEYVIGRMCGGDNTYKDQQHLIEQGLIPNPMYHTHPLPNLGPSPAHTSYAAPSAIYDTSLPNGNVHFPYTNGHGSSILAAGNYPCREMPMALTANVRVHLSGVDQLSRPISKGDHTDGTNERPASLKRSLSSDSDAVLAEHNMKIEEVDQNEEFQPVIEQSTPETVEEIKTVQPKKRGRRRKSADTNALAKLALAANGDDTGRRNGREKPYDPWADRKASGEAFIQDGPCFGLLDVSSKKFAKCVSCRTMTDENNECRFKDFRKLRFVGDMVQAEGFTDSSDAKDSDSRVWMSGTPNDSEKDDVASVKKTAKMVLTNIGDILCDLVKQEMQVIENFNHLLPKDVSLDKAIRWKRVYGVREMCDVCSTTIFNLHWTCNQCGFVSCTDCFQSRVDKKPAAKNTDPAKDNFRWLFCGNPKSMRNHDPSKLMLTKIIPSDLLEKLNDEQHEIRAQFGIPRRCSCVSSINLADEMLQKRRAVIDLCIRPTLTIQIDVQNLNALCRGGLRSRTSNSVIQPVNQPSVSTVHADTNTNVGNALPAQQSEPWDRSLLDIAQEVIAMPQELKRLPVSSSKQRALALRVVHMGESKNLYGVPHKWLCKGKLLLLLDATHLRNLSLFQEQWNRGQPIVVAHVSKVLDMNLWHPDAFLRDFGEQKSSLVDCKTGSDLGKLIPMKKFWEGFECFAKRMKDRDGEYMLLKLKDWPPDENFSEVLPTRYQDLMKALPLPMYTLRHGSLNLANRLPKCFIPPDLGPKMYNAYGSALFPSKGTTNLHLDMSDAANVMVYVGIPRDGNCQSHIEEALRAVEEAGCDPIQMKRVREKDARVGAVWHIFNAQDAEAIRHLLRKVTVEQGRCVETNSDPIHDQLWYLDRTLRSRLWKEYGVEGYAIAQCLGDTVFIPAGAPHQVRNLHSCIKVAEDFVSPENLAHCLRLTNEFRFLSDSHTNHEDKLQIKNVVFHAVKDAVSTLRQILLSNQDDSDLEIRS